MKEQMDPAATPAAELEEQSRASLGRVVLPCNGLYLAWSGFDLLLVPEHWLPLLAVRVVVVLIATLALLASRRPAAKGRGWQLSLVAYLSYGLGVVALLPWCGGALGYYSLGFALTILGIGVIPVWPPSWSAPTLGLVTLCFLLWLGQARAVPGSERGFLGFMVSTAAVIALLAAASRYRSIVSALEGRLREHRLGLELARARDEALAAARAKSEFLANMSHEIRTPMNAVVGYASLLGEGSLDGGQRECVDGIQEACALLVHLIDDVLDFSKLEARRVDLEPGPLSVRELGEEGLSLVARAAAKKGLGLYLDLGPGVPESIVADRLRLQQVLLNLLGNAVKFTPAGGVWLSWRLLQPELLAVTVRDTGIGVAPELRGRLFRPFTQADASITRRFGGTGLGLSISRLLVEAMGGRLELLPPSGPGSSFRFTLPFRPDPAPPARPRLGGRAAIRSADPELARVLGASLADLGVELVSAEEQAGVVFADVRGAAEWRAERPVIWVAEVDRSPLAHGPVLRWPPRRRSLAALLAPPAPPCAALAQVPRLAARVLVAEDNAVNQRLIRRMLEGLGCQVEVAENGLRAVQAACAQPWDLVLMDAQMPELDGLEATQRIRATPGGAELFVVALTANASDEYRQACLAAGMDDFLTKPVTRERLAALLAERTLSRRASAGA